MNTMPVSWTSKILILWSAFLVFVLLPAHAGKDLAWLDGKRVHFKGYKDVFQYTRVKIIGNPSNVTRIYFCVHGDGNTDYSSSTSDDRQQMAAALEQDAPGEGAIVAYPVSMSSRWPTFESGKNGRIILTMFQRLELITGNENVQFQIFSLSGGGRVNHALLRLINQEYEQSDDVRDFVDNHLKGIHDGDSLCYSITDMRNQYISAIRSFPGVRFCFIHNTSGQMSYVHSHHNKIAVTIGNESYPYGGSLSLQDGRLRFWSAKTHWTAWKGQFSKVFFGTTAAFMVSDAEEEEPDHPI